MEDNTRIERRITDLARKHELMAQWDRRIAASARRRSRLAYIYGAAAAVAVVLLAAGAFLLAPRTDAPAPVMDETASTWDEIQWRSGSDADEVLELVSAGDCEGALRLIDSLQADTAVDPSLPAQQREYIRIVNAERAYELEWIRINILVNTGRTDQARALLEEYSRREGDRRESAAQMLQELM